MSDMKPKLSLRSGVNIAEKSTSPSTKLMLNHGKPNFTINKSKPNGDSQNSTPQVTSEAAKVVLKNTTSNGYVKPSNLKLSTENEVEKVVLRRTKLPETNGKSIQQDDEPEFIKAQRKIAERLANQNNLDFESRKSGYFTHVMMSPTSPSKAAEFVPSVSENTSLQKPSDLDDAVISKDIKPAVDSKNIEVDQSEKKSEVNKSENSHDENGKLTNGQIIHENGDAKESIANEQRMETVEVAKALIDELVQVAAKEVPNSEEVGKVTHDGHENNIPNKNSHENTKQNGECQLKENGHTENSPKSDVNFEPKTVVSFSKELSSEPNKYPDTVIVTSQVKPAVQDEFLQDMYKLKFDIHADSEDVKVTPTIRTE